MNSIWRPLLAVLVSTLGLMSCAPDKPGPKHDDWRLTPPEIRFDDSVVVANAADKSQVARVPVDATLIFPSLSGNQAGGVTLDLLVRCSGQGKTVSQAFKIKSTSALPLKSVVPVRLLTTVGQEKNSELVCSLSGVGINLVGSKHSFTLPEFQVTNLERAVDSQTLDAASVSQALQKFDGQRNLTKARLACEKFENFRKVEGIPADQLLNLLVEGPVAMMDEAGLAEIEDGRVSMPWQKCQFALESIEAETGLPVRWVSAIAPVRFPNPKPVVHGQYTLGQGTLEQIRDHEFFQVSIGNPYQTTLTLRFQAPAREGIELLPVKLDEQGPTYGRLFREKLLFSVTGVPDVKVDNDLFRFTIPPGGTAQISARIQSKMICGATPGSFAGWAFRLLNRLDLQMIVPGRDQREEVVVVPWPFEIAYENTWLPSGYIASEAFAAQTGLRTLPAHVHDGWPICQSAADLSKVRPSMHW